MTMEPTSGATRPQTMFLSVDLPAEIAPARIGAGGGKGAWGEVGQS